jgi:hypothetical protein
MQTKMLIDGKQARKEKPGPSLIKLIVRSQALKVKFIQGGDTLGHRGGSEPEQLLFHPPRQTLLSCSGHHQGAIVEGRHPDHSFRK